MSDPVAQVIGLLQPSAAFSKMVVASGRWAVRPPLGTPFYGAMLDGEGILSPDGGTPISLRKGDFHLLSMTEAVTVTSPDPPASGWLDELEEIGPGLYRVGEPGPANARMLIGHYQFASNDAALLVSLLPPLVVVRGEPRLPVLVSLLSEEARAERPGRDVVLSRLLEVLLIEALRTEAAADAAPGLLRGLANRKIAVALRSLHGDPGHGWTVAALARACGLSRSSFFDRFRREVGISPMDYLLGWRMALARDLLRSGEAGVGEIARRVGYSSQSTFSVAFTRHVGMSPTAFARGRQTPDPVVPAA